MTALYSVSVGEHGSFRARHGDRLLDAALINGVDLPHDCRSGHCGACRCILVSGDVAGGHTDAPGSILACQARVGSDLQIGVEETPEVETFKGTVVGVKSLSHDVVEVTMTTTRPFVYLPGQYSQFRFAGYPVRCYSPTNVLDGPADPSKIRLQVRRVRGGRLSNAFGEQIQAGHKVRITGPFGSAYLRPGKKNRLVLVSGGTGFAPIWSIAHAALCEMPDREIVVVAGVNERRSLYMAPALLRLVAFPKVDVRAVIRRSDEPNSFHIGDPLDYVPKLTADDVVYSAGAPNMVDGVAALSRAAGACCYVDPFAPAASGDDEDAFSWAKRVLEAAAPLNVIRWFDRGAAADEPSPAQCDQQATSEVRGANIVELRGRTVAAEVKPVRQMPEISRPRLRAR